MATWFQYDYCRDVVAMRDFFMDDIGMQLVWEKAGTFESTADSGRS